MASTTGHGSLRAVAGRRPPGAERASPGVWQSARMTIIDVRTRKLGDDRVEAVAITDAEEPDGSPVVVRGYGPTPEEAIADAKAKAEARVAG